MLTKGYRGLEGITRGYMGYKRFQRFAKGYRGLFCFYDIEMTFRIVSCIHNLECMLTTLISPMRTMMLKKIERCVNIDLGRIRIWLAANKLTLNTTKTISVKWVQVKTVNTKKESHKCRL